MSKNIELDYTQPIICSNFFEEIDNFGDVEKKLIIKLLEQIKTNINQYGVYHIKLNDSPVQEALINISNIEIVFPIESGFQRVRLIESCKYNIKSNVIELYLPNRICLFFVREIFVHKNL